MGIVDIAGVTEGVGKVIGIGAGPAGRAKVCTIVVVLGVVLAGNAMGAAVMVAGVATEFGRPSIIAEVSSAN